MQALPLLWSHGEPYLPRGLDALDDSQADHDPSHKQGQGHLPVQAAGVVDGAGNVESLAVPEVSGGRALLTLRHHDYNNNEERQGNGINCAPSMESANIQNHCWTCNLVMHFTANLQIASGGGSTQMFCLRKSSKNHNVMSCFQNIKVQKYEQQNLLESIKRFLLKCCIHWFIITITAASTHVFKTYTDHTRQKPPS